MSWQTGVASPSVSLGLVRCGKAASLGAGREFSIDRHRRANGRVCIVVRRGTPSSDLRRPVSEALLYQHRNLENRPGVAKSVRKAHPIACPS